MVYLFPLSLPPFFLPFSKYSLNISTLWKVLYKVLEIGSLLELPVLKERERSIKTNKYTVANDD